MRVYSVLLAVTIGFLANSAAVAAKRDEAGASKLLRSENADSRRLIIGFEIGDDMAEIGARAEEALRTNEHLKGEMAKWCAEVVNKVKELKQQGLKTGKMAMTSTGNEQMLQLEMIYKDFMLAKGLSQKEKIVCEDKKKNMELVLN